MANIHKPQFVWYNSAMTSIEGTVLSIVFRNDENGWTVMEVDFNGELTTAVGCMPHIHEGEFVRLFGAWTEHRMYGRQFSVTSVETRLPGTAESIKLFLASGLIKGVGEGLAGRIVDRFGTETFDVIENSPEELAGVRGVSKKLAESIHESFLEHVGVKQIIIDLQSLGLSVKQAFRAFERYGAAAATLIRENPYRMIDDIAGIGFERADKIAAVIGVEPASDYRIDMGIRHELVTAMNEGHTCLPRYELIRRAGLMLGVPEALVEARIAALTLSDQVAQKFVNNTPAVYHMMAYITETDIAQRLYLLSRCAPRVPIRDAASAYERYIGDVALVGGAGARGAHGAVCTGGGHHRRAGVRARPPSSKPSCPYSNRAA